MKADRSQSIWYYRPAIQQVSKLCAAPGQKFAAVAQRLERVPRTHVQLGLCARSTGERLIETQEVLMSRALNTLMDENELDKLLQTFASHGTVESGWVEQR